MNIHGIVQWLYLDRRVNEFIARQKPTNLQADLLHHCITEIYRIHDKYPGKIEALYQSEQLWPWFHGMACQQLHSNKSTFYTRFRREFVDASEIDRNMPDQIPYKDRERELYETIYIRNGKRFADYAMKDIDRQEEERINNFDRPKIVTAVEQMRLF